MSSVSISSQLQKSGLSESELNLFVNLLAEQVTSEVNCYLLDNFDLSSELILPMVKACIYGMLGFPTELLRNH
jgi:hypothetical protein